VFEVEQDQGGFGNRADPPRAQADASQGLEGGLDLGVCAFGDSVARWRDACIRTA
jgi:hypothetical protein